MRSVEAWRAPCTPEPRCPGRRLGLHSCRHLRIWGRSGRDQPCATAGLGALTQQGVPGLTVCLDHQGSTLVPTRLKEFWVSLE